MSSTVSSGVKRRITVARLRQSPSTNRDIQPTSFELSDLLTHKEEARDGWVVRTKRGPSRCERGPL